MTNAPARTAVSEPSQHTTETKKVELNKLYSNTVYVLKLVYVRSSTEASLTEALQTLKTLFLIYRNPLQIKYFKH